MIDKNKLTRTKKFEQRKIEFSLFIIRELCRLYFFKSDTTMKNYFLIESVRCIIENCINLIEFELLIIFIKNCY